MEDPVHDGVAVRAVLNRDDIDTFILAIRNIRGAEDGRAVLGMHLNDLEQLIGLLKHQ